MSIEIRCINNNDIFDASKMMADSCRIVYKKVMSDDYLNSIEDNQYVKFLETGLNKSVIDCFVAENNRMIIGISILRKSNIQQYPDDAEIYAIYLLPDFIGKGIGHELYICSENLIKQQGYKNCSLVVLSQNNGAIEFYKQHDFTKTSHSTKVNLRGQELLCDIMRKHL